MIIQESVNEFEFWKAIDFLLCERPANLLEASTTSPTKADIQALEYILTALNHFSRSKVPEEHAKLYFDAFRAVKDRLDTFEDPELINAAKLFKSLSPKEAEILDLLKSGKPTKVIAKEIARSENTVRNQIASIYDKLQVGNRTEATILALRHGPNNMIDEKYKDVIGNVQTALDRAKKAEEAKMLAGMSEKDRASYLTAKNIKAKADAAKKAELTRAAANIGKNIATDIMGKVTNKNTGPIKKIGKNINPNPGPGQQKNESFSENYSEAFTPVLNQSQKLAIDDLKSAASRLEKDRKELLDLKEEREWAQEDLEKVYREFYVKLERAHSVGVTEDQLKSAGIREKEMRVQESGGNDFQNTLMSEGLVTDISDKLKYATHSAVNLAGRGAELIHHGASAAYVKGGELAHSAYDKSGAAYKYMKPKMIDAYEHGKSMVSLGASAVKHGAEIAYQNAVPMGKALLEKGKQGAIIAYHGAQAAGKWVQSSPMAMAMLTFVASEFIKHLVNQRHGTNNPSIFTRNSGSGVNSQTSGPAQPAGPEWDPVDEAAFKNYINKEPMWETERPNLINMWNNASDAVKKSILSGVQGKIQTHRSGDHVKWHESSGLSTGMSMIESYNYRINEAAKLQPGNMEICFELYESLVESERLNEGVLESIEGYAGAVWETVKGGAAEAAKWVDRNWARIFVLACVAIYTASMAKFMHEDFKAYKNAVNEHVDNHNRSSEEKARENARARANANANANRGPSGKREVDFTWAVDDPAFRDGAMKWINSQPAVMRQALINKLMNMSPQDRKTAAGIFENMHRQYQQTRTNESFSANLSEGFVDWAKGKIDKIKANGVQYDYERAEVMAGFDSAVEGLQNDCSHHPLPISFVKNLRNGLKSPRALVLKTRSDGHNYFVMNFNIWIQGREGNRWNETQGQKWMKIQEEADKKAAGGSIKSGRKTESSSGSSERRMVEKYLSTFNDPAEVAKYVNSRKKFKNDSDIPMSDHTMFNVDHKKDHQKTPFEKEYDEWQKAHREKNHKENSRLFDHGSKTGDFSHYGRFQDEQDYERDKKFKELKSKYSQKRESAQDRLKEVALIAPSAEQLVHEAVQRTGKKLNDSVMRQFIDNWVYLAKTEYREMDRRHLYNLIEEDLLDQYESMMKRKNSGAGMYTGKGRGWI